MLRLDIYKKQAKQLVRWHREGNHSVGERIRRLARYKTLTDREALKLEFPLHLAQEIVAREAGYASWSELKTATENERVPVGRVSQAARLTRAIPVMFVANVEAAATFFTDTLGFSIDFLHGEPAFYGAVSRDGAVLHLKFVHAPVMSAGPQDQRSFINAYIEVENIKALYSEYIKKKANFSQKLTKEPWGGHDFIVRDRDGNAICFAGRSPETAIPNQRD